MQRYSSIGTHSMLQLSLLASLFSCQPNSSLQSPALGSPNNRHAIAASVVQSGCSSGDPDTDGDGICDATDNCFLEVNPDQVDLDLDTLGDPCDLAPNVSDASNSTVSASDASTIIDPDLPTTLLSPDGALAIELPAGAVASFATLTAVLSEPDASVRAQGEVDSSSLDFLDYRIFIGGQGVYDFASDYTLSLTVSLDAASSSVSRSFRNLSLALYSLEDSDGDGLQNGLVLIPNCFNGELTDGRCSLTQGIDLNGDLAFDRILISTQLPEICCNDGLNLDLDLDGYEVTEGDCNDYDNSVYPGAEEVCDSRDNDCDSVIDNVPSGSGTLFYADADGDGFGLESTSVSACEAPDGFVALGGDCNDADVSFYPGAAENCSGRDNDCDGNSNEGYSCHDISRLDLSVFGP